MSHLQEHKPPKKSMPLHTPNFIGIGPGKCGTTWLYYACSQHPDVCVSSAKETLYFEDYYHKGPKWYLRFFKDCKCPDQPHAVGEVSNTYVFAPTAAERIAQDFPSIKIIFNLRDPIERAFSHFLFLKRNGQLDGTFEEAIKIRPDLLERGKYAQHLTVYFERFRPEQRLGLFFDDLKSDPVGYAQTVFRFLGVAPQRYAGDPAQRILEASTPRSRILAKLVVGAAAVTRKLGYPDLVTKVKHSHLPKLIFRQFAKGEAPKLSLATREDLKSFYAQDLAQLADMTGRDVQQLWKY